MHKSYIAKPTDQRGMIYKRKHIPIHLYPTIPLQSLYPFQSTFIHSYPTIPLQSLYPFQSNYTTPIHLYPFQSNYTTPILISIPIHFYPFLSNYTSPIIISIPIQLYHSNPLISIPIQLYHSNPYLHSNPTIPLHSSPLSLTQRVWGPWSNIGEEHPTIGLTFTYYCFAGLLCVVER